MRAPTLTFESHEAEIQHGGLDLLRSIREDARCGLAAAMDVDPSEVRVRLRARLGWGSNVDFEVDVWSRCKR